MLTTTTGTDLLDRLMGRLANDRFKLDRFKLDRFKLDIARTKRSTTNGFRHLVRTDRQPMGVSAKDTVWRRDKVQLWRYRGKQQPGRPPVLLVHSLVSRSYVLDLRPGNSFVEALLARGHDVFLIDWGIPDEIEAGNTLETYCLEYIPRAVQATLAASGADEFTMFGYCFGGVLSLLYAAAHPQAPLAGLTVMAAPIDSRHMPTIFLAPLSSHFQPEALLDENGNVPATSILAAFRALKPTADLAGVASLVHNLCNSDFINAYNAMTTWSRDHIPFPGAAFRQTIDLLLRKNAFVDSGLELAGRQIDLRAITAPFLAVYGLADHIVPPASAAPVLGLVGSKDRTELALPAGHVGLIVGRSAHSRNVPAMIDWLDEHPRPASQRAVTSRFERQGVPA